ncbi:E3 ubiquitin-protein ligase TRIM34-like [Mercenaria mercenaria]|uniref:E3 ubiquitin-protein ligase TRIM34-like n=1 Tax=Mercenaria mercenaria TaxID=6596 RepID=UPI00234EB286|nr:E3 ubiquitin-protein ligase TRIM34-like [Mercenaria mercenaria]
MATTEELEEELYCPICADVFDDPLMLPCTHSFCGKCLKERITKGNVTRKSTSVIFDCPVCRKEVKLDESGLDTLPRNRLLKKMVDLFRTQAVSNKQLLRTSQNFTEICEDHEKELGAFCSVCWEVVCIDCVIGDHRGHPIESVDDVYNKQRRSLERKKEELEEERKILCNSREDEFKYMEQLKDLCKKKIESIEVQFDEYICLIQQSKDSILAEIAARQRKELNKIQQVIDTIDSKEDELKVVLKELTEIMKRDKLKLLKESSRFKDKKAKCVSTSRSSSGSESSLSATCDTLRSPRTRCFLDCTLQLDGAALESAINSAHLIWEADSDAYSPKHLSDKFTQLYEKEWKNAYLESSSKNKDEVVIQLFNILTDSYRHAELCSETHLESLTYHMLQPDIDVQVGEFNIHGFNNVESEAAESTSFCSIKEGIRKLRAKHAPDFMEDISYMIQQDLPPLSVPSSSGSHRQLSVYANKCFELSFAIRLQDPPFHVEIKKTEKNDINELDKDAYKFVKRRGRKTKTIAWPPLYLYKGGPLLAKGTVFIPG